VLSLLRSGKSFSPALVHTLIRPTAWYVPKICGTSHGSGNNQENPYHKTRYALMRILPVLPTARAIQVAGLFYVRPRSFDLHCRNWYKDFQEYARRLAHAVLGNFPLK
jgi:hypothetical protein